jgi:hypothetical protein
LEQQRVAFVEAIGTGRLHGSGRLTVVARGPPSPISNQTILSRPTCAAAVRRGLRRRRIRSAAISVKTSNAMRWLSAQALPDRWSPNA